MFRRFVEHRVRATWDALDRRDPQPVLQGFASHFTYENLGADHALGGTFSTVPEMAAHFETLFRLLPDIAFDVRDVLVGGNPVKTTVVTRVAVTATLPGGTPYTNELVQWTTLRLGKVVSVRALMDNVRAQQALDVIGSHDPTALSAPVSA